MGVAEIMKGGTLMDEMRAREEEMIREKQSELLRLKYQLEEMTERS